MLFEYPLNQSRHNILLGPAQASNLELSPENLWDKFQQRSSQSNYATRHCKDLQIPRLNTEHAKKSYQYSTVKIWNTIPTDIRELPTISHFKKRLKEFLKS